MTRHGFSGKRLYRIYTCMVQRCYYSEQQHYQNYGARGITVCREWLEDRETFFDWALANGYSDDLTLDRVDNDGPYAPGNCRWATQSEQSRNKRSNRLVTAWGETKTLAEWMRDERCSNTCYETVRGRLVRGVPAEEALASPPQTREEQARSMMVCVTAWGETKSLLDWSRDERCGCSYRALVQRHCRGWEPERMVAQPARWARV